MDRQLRDLLEAAVGEPPRKISIETVRRRVARRRAVEYTSGAAAAAVIAALIPAGIGALGHGPAAPRTGGQGPARGPIVYVANSGSGTVTPIRTATNTALKPVKTGRLPQAIAITPDGTTAYVTSGLLGTVTRPGTVTPIRVATNTALARIKVGGLPGPIAITPDGKTAYVVKDSFTPRGFSGTVVPIRTATNTALSPVKVGRGASAIAITP